MWSARAALLESRQQRIAASAEPLFEGALRALSVADEILARRFAGQGRARTFLVASLMTQVREGKVLSGSNEKLLRAALEALHDADDALTGVDSALDQGQRAISNVLDVANPDGGPGDPDDKKSGEPGPNATGIDGDQGGGTGSKNPIAPVDGAGPRSAAPKKLPASVVAARLAVERMKREGR